jgi:MFS family permease
MRKVITLPSVKGLLIGLLWSSMATTTIQFAISLYILDQTGSGRLFANTLAGAMIAKIIFTPLGGGLIDRLSKKWLMVSLDGLYMILTLMLLIVPKENLVLGMVVYSIVVGAISTLETPVVQAAVPFLVESQDLMVMNGLVSQITVLSGIFGPILAGILYKAINLQSMILIASGCFLGACLTEITLKIPTEHYEKQTIIQNLRSTCKYLSQERNISRIAWLAGSINLLVVGFIEVAVPVIFRLKFKLNAEIFGLVQAGLAVGILLAATLTGGLIKKIGLRNLYRLMIGAMLPLGITGLLLLLNSVENLLIGMMVLSLMVIQFTFTLVSIVMLSQIQATVEVKRLGSVMALVMLISMVAIPLGEGIYGQILSSLSSNLQLGILLIGITLVTILVAWINRTLFT